MFSFSYFILCFQGIKNLLKGSLPKTAPIVDDRDPEGFGG
jgi:hypothetical protein